MSERVGPSPFKIGEQYKTQEGKWVRFVSISNEGQGTYETMADELGVHRYSRGGKNHCGRVTGTAHDFSEPRNVMPPWPKVLGHQFFPMDYMDWSCYGGAESGTLIYHVNDELDLLWDPTNKILSEMHLDPDGKDDSYRQRDWTFKEVG